jgi:hypothetical protein
MKISEAVKMYVKLRDEAAELKRSYQNEADKIKEKMDRIEAACLGAMDATGVESVRVEGGTAYISTQTCATVADRETFLNYCRENNEWALMDIRASKTAIAQFKTATDDLPPGINWRAERVVNFRRES